MTLDVYAGLSRGDLDDVTARLDLLLERCGDGHGSSRRTTRD
jgi:hypothetical protein